jgi:hypothetical protein
VLFGALAGLDLGDIGGRKGGDACFLSPGPKRTHNLAGNPDDAPFLAEQIIH